MGRAAQQDAQFIFLLNLLPLELGRAGGHIGALRLELVGVQFGDHALPQAGLRNPDRLFPRLERPPGDIQLHVELQQLEISLGHQADQLQNHRASIFLLRKQLGPRRLVRAPDAAP